MSRRSGVSGIGKAAWPPRGQLAFEDDRLKQPEFLSDNELEERWPLWQALADFWLDNELQDFELDNVARAIAQSRFKMSQVRQIHDFEVAPAVSANLLSVAGEWAGFDPVWLRARCARQAQRRRFFWYRILVGLQRPFFWVFTARYWKAVEERLGAIESLRDRLDR